MATVSTSNIHGLWRIAQQPPRRQSAHCWMSVLRRSNRSLRRQAASTRSLDKAGYEK